MPARIVPWTPLTLQLHGRLRRERASPSVSRCDNRPLPGPARRPRALTGRRCGPWVRLAWNNLPAGASLVPITTPFEAFHRSTLRRWFSSPGCTSRLPASRASDSHVMPGSVPRGPAQTSIAGRVRRGLLRHTSPPSPVADDLPPPALRRAQDGVADLGRPVTVLKGGPGRQTFGNFGLSLSPSPRPHNLSLQHSVSTFTSPVSVSTSTSATVVTCASVESGSHVPVSRSIGLLGFRNMPWLARGSRPETAARQLSREQISNLLSSLRGSAQAPRAKAGSSARRPDRRETRAPLGRNAPSPRC